MSTPADGSVRSAEPSPAPRRGFPKRIWFPNAVLALLAVAMVVIWLGLPETVDRGMRLMATNISFATAMVTLAVWYFTMSGLSRRTRLVSGVVLGLLILAALISVRRIEFSGDMAPTFDFRWTTDRFAALEAHRAQQRAESRTGEAAPAAAPVEVTITPEDVLEYRGPNRDGVVQGVQLARDWSARPPKLVWRQPVGGGYASFVIARPLVITIEQRRDKEAVVAYDFDTGREIWLHEYPALFSETLGGDGPRATPTIHDGKLYALGATGVLTCLELTTGKPHWSVNILKDNGSANLDWGMSGSPLVYDGLVLVNPGNQKGTPASHSITAFDAQSGKRLWGGGQAKASYASPMLGTLAGVRQVLNFDAAGLAGHDPADGRELWRVPWKSDFDINAAQPVVVGDNRVLISSTTGATLIELSANDGQWTHKEVWRNRKMKCGYACPVAYQGHLYGIDETILACIEIDTGKQLWKDRAGQYGHGQLLLVGDLLVVLGEAGELALVEASPEGFKELGRIQAIEGKTWNNPAMVGNRIFVRNHLEMAAYDLPSPSSGE